MNNNMEVEIDWSVLPEEVWSAIGKLLDRRLDLLRFRSVCKLWRSIIPPLSDSASPPPPRWLLTLPVHSGRRADDSTTRTADAFLSQTTVYRIDRPFEDLDSSSSAQGWLVKVEETDKGKMRILDPISSRKIREIPDAVSNSCRLLEFRMMELIKTYALRYTCGSGSIAGVNKVMLAPNSGAIFVIYENGVLGVVKNGEKEIVPIDDRIFDYNDLIMYGGQPYVVDRWGTVSWIDSSFRLIQFAPPLSGFDGRKHMVVSCGDLYVVVRYLEKEEENALCDRTSGLQFRIQYYPRGRGRRRDFNQPKSVDFKVFKLDQDRGTWVEVKNLGDQVFVLSCDFSLSVLAGDFAGFKPNCIYFTKQFGLDYALRGIGDNGVCIFNLEDNSFENLENSSGYSQMFWPGICPNS
ncbi:hypothetical protein UlMin_039679 [Ulmus minor]